MGKLDGERRVAPQGSGSGILCKGMEAREHDQFGSTVGGSCGLGWSTSWGRGME